MVSNILKSEKVKFLARVVIVSLIFPLLYSYFVRTFKFVTLSIALFSSIIDNIDKIISACFSLTSFIEHHITIAYTCSFVAIYLYLKIFGVLKKSNKLNFFYVLLTFAIGIYMAQPMVKHMSDDIIPFNVTLLFIPVFLLHRLFNFLTKKFPIPFERIGYYTSIECLSDFYNNHKNKQQIKETKEIEKAGFIHKILKSEKFNFVLRTLIAYLIFPLVSIFLIYAGIGVAIIILQLPPDWFFVFFLGDNSFQSSEIYFLALGGLVAITFGPFLAIYLYLKIFGILKQSDKLNTFFVLFIFLLGIGINYIYLYLTHSPDIFVYTMEFFGFILALFLHKFFNFLTKKYPTPFE